MKNRRRMGEPRKGNNNRRSNRGALKIDEEWVRTNKSTEEAWNILFDECFGKCEPKMEMVENGVDGMYGIGMDREQTCNMNWCRLGHEIDEDSSNKWSVVVWDVVSIGRTAREKVDQWTMWHWQRRHMDREQKTAKFQNRLQIQINETRPNVKTIYKDNIYKTRQRYRLITNVREFGKQNRRSKAYDKIWVLWYREVEWRMGSGHPVQLLEVRQNIMELSGSQAKTERRPTGHFGNHMRSSTNMDTR